MSVTLDELDRLLHVEVAHAWFDRPWGRQHVVTAGPTDAPAVMLLHGWPQHWFAWRHLIEGMAGDHRVIALDTRGFGWSTIDGRPRARVGELARDVVAVLDELEIDQAELVGHDWGGWIGFRAALDHGDRFSAYTGLAIVPPWIDAKQMARSPMSVAYIPVMAVAGSLVARWPKAVSTMIRWSTGNWIWDDLEDSVAHASYLERVGHDAAPAMTGALYRHLLFGELPRAWRRQPQPVNATVLLGERERISRREIIRGDHDMCRDPIAGVGHWLAEEAPADVVAYLRA